MKTTRKILMYHSIDSGIIEDPCAQLYTVSVDNFRKQVELLSKAQDPKNMDNLIISFDDGLADNYTNALPILKKLNLNAYFFILAGKIGTANYMTWEQIRELQNNGMIIGSHGLAHKILTGLKEKELDEEINKSKEILEKNLGQRIDYFSIPMGAYNKAVIKKIGEAGYKKVFTSNYKDNGDFKIGRIAVKSSWDIEYFTQVMKNGLSLKDRISENLKNSAKMILGQRCYSLLKARALKQ